MVTYIKENTWLERGGFLDFGWGNGYAILSKEHPFHGYDYDTLNNVIDIHWGLTYAGEITADMPGVLADPFLAQYVGHWMIGFDTAHYDDTLLKWPKERVQQEADELLRQCFEYSGMDMNSLIKEKEEEN